MIYQEKFELTEASSVFFSSQFDILITGNKEENDERHSYIRMNLKEFSGKVFCLDTCENADKFLYKIESPIGDIIESKNNLSLIPDLEKFLRAKDILGKRVCIDITTLKQGILFFLVKLLLTDIKPSLLFAGYTEPQEYRKRTITGLGDAEEFDLYDKLIGSSKGVPGFIKHQGKKDILLISPMGFDSQRLQTIYENLKPKKLIPIVGFPSFVPGWNLTAIKMNFMVLRQSECYDRIEQCESASPFELFDKLKELYHRDIGQYDIYIASLGTRPHCLGAALFASQYPSVYLVYDFPVEKKYRSEKVLKASIYHLSKYIA